MVRGADSMTSRSRNISSRRAASIMRPVLVAEVDVAEFGVPQLGPQSVPTETQDSAEVPGRSVPRGELGDLVDESYDVVVGHRGTDDEQVPREQRRLEDATQRSAPGVVTDEGPPVEDDGIRVLDVPVQLEQPGPPLALSDDLGWIRIWEDDQRLRPTDLEDGALEEPVEVGGDDLVRVQRSQECVTERIALVAGDRLGDVLPEQVSAV